MTINGKALFLFFLLFIISCSEDELTEKDNDHIQQILSKIDIVNVEGGDFVFGQWLNQPKVISVNTFGISKHEVTRELWLAVLGEDYLSKYFSDPGFTYGDYTKICPTCPVENIDVPDVHFFLDKLNDLTGKRYRLPTESEWEFAYRGGNKTMRFTFSGSNNVNDVGWYQANCFQPQPVGTKRPNELGLYDMEGNVSELCSDYSGFHVGNFPISPQLNNPTGAAYGSYKVQKGSSASCWLLTDGLGREYLNCGFGGMSSLDYGAFAFGYDPAGNTYSNAGFRIAEQLVEEPLLKIGQTYQGGTIVYIDESGEHGLILSGLDAAVSSYEFSCPQLILGTLSENGLINSQAIANACLGITTAASYCLNLTYGGYSDWYLPSVQELFKIHHNLGVTSLHPETVLYLMTSNTGSSSPSQFYFQYLAQNYTGFTVEYMGSGPSKCRPVRAF